ncbi:MAG: hypothetical protein ACE141_00200 [Bryobacteraceae bacterium]
MRLATSALLALTTAVCLAQSWEAGGAAGGGYAPGVTASNLTGEATAGLAASPAFGAYIGQDISSRLGGEIRYLFRPADLKLASGGTRVVFGGQSHLVHYDLVIYGKPADSKARPFLTGGAGVRLSRGTGQESSYQPLWEYALLTRTRQAQPVVSLGGGFKVKLSRKYVLRAEIRDYASPFPREVISPAAGAKISGWLHDIVPLVGIGRVF